MLPLGACVHATPLFESLHESLPELPVYVATRGIGAEVLRYNPSLAGLLVTGDVFRDLRGVGKALRSLLRARGLRPAWIVTDASNRRSKMAIIGAVYLKAPLIGFNLATALQTITLEIDPGKSMIANNLAIAGALGGATAHREPTVCVSTKQVEDARNLLKRINPDSQPIVIVSTQPSGGQPTEWRDACWQQVLQHVTSRGMLPVFVGIASQSKAIDRIRGSAVSVSLAGHTDVPTLAAVLALSDVCISIDTGTLHVARAARVPLVALAPTFQDPVEWLPLDLPHARVVRGKGTAPVGPDYHLDEIEAAHVIIAFDELLEQFSPREESREERLRALISSVDHLAVD